MADPEFRADLFRGAGRDYDRFRLPYPQPLIDDLAWRSGATGEGWLLDLGCGTGQISFALRGQFAQTWAVDQEPDMISVVREKAGAADDMRIEVSAAEDASAPEESFDLVAIGNAFHRMRREAVAARVVRWLRPGGFLALVWGGSPWAGEEPWQRALEATMQVWRTQAEGRERVPAGYEQARQARPDAAILGAAGLEMAGSFEFPTVHDWTPDTIVGFVFSTSVLSRHALGDLAPEFERDLRRALDPHARAGPLRQTMDFAYQLARKPQRNNPGPITIPGT